MLGARYFMLFYRLLCAGCFYSSWFSFRRTFFFFLSGSGCVASVCVLSTLFCSFFWIPTTYLTTSAIDLVACLYGVWESMLFDISQ